MSLLADLLSKVKPSGRKGGVPPNLKKVVADLSGKRANRKKIITYSVLVFLSIAGGIGAMFFVDLYLKPKAGTRTSDISIAELKKRAQARLPSQAIDQKQKKEETKKNTDRKITVESKPTVDKQEEVSGKIEQMPKVVKKEPKEVSKEPPKEIEKQKEEKQEPDIKQEEIEKTDEPGESYEIAAKEPETREVAPLNKDLHLYMARSYENKRDYSKAFDSYKQVLDADPNNYLVMNNISGLLLHLESFEESIEYSEMALNVKKDYVPSLINLGIAHIKSGNLTAGEGYLLKVLSLQPTNKHALFNLALLYEKIGEYDRAYGLYKKLSRMKDTQGYLGLARIAEKQNRVSDAIILYTKLMSMDGIDPRIKKMANDRINMLR